MEELNNYLTKILTIRKFEEKLLSLYSKGLIRGTTHVCVGQEAVAVGAMESLKIQDYIVSHHRGHGHAIARGLSVNKLMAEFLGKSEGYCSGKGGSQHVASKEHNFLGTNGITGGGIPIATGAALSIKLKKESDRVSVSFFGDGATNQGVFFESLNIASLWKLPIIYICENNCYAMSTSIKESHSVKNISDKAKLFGIPAFVVDGNNVEEVKKIVESARDYSLINGPVFIECLTYRHLGHSKSDTRPYRTREEEAEWLGKDCVKRIEEKISREDFEKINELTEKIIEEAYLHSANSNSELNNGEIYSK